MVEANLSPSPGRRARDLLILVLLALVGLTLTGVATRLAWLQRDVVLQRELGEAAHDIEHSLDRQVGRVVAFVETLAAFIESSNEVNRQEFDSFLGRTSSHWPGLVAVSWQAWVPEEERSVFEARMQRDVPEYRLVERDAEGALVPAAARPIHLPIVHTFSAGGQTNPPGFDTAAQPTWLAARMAAIEAPSAFATGAFDVRSSGGGTLGTGFSINDSVLAPGVAPARERVRGFVSAVFAYVPMIDAAMAGTRLDDLRLAVRDTGDAVPAYLSRAAREEGLPGGSLVQTRSLAVAGRMWEVTLAPALGFSQGIIVGLPWYVLGAGLGITVACVLIVLWRQRVRLDHDLQVQERLAIERRFRDVVDRMSGAVFVMRGHDTGNRLDIVELNAAATQLAGVTAEAAIGRDFSQIMPGAVEAGLVAALGQVRRSGEAHRMEVTEIQLGDQSRHVQAVCFRVGQGGEICAVLHDLTELKAAESALREARDELELALDVSRVGLWSWDLAANRVRLDSRCARLFGLGETESVDSATLTARVHPEDLKVIRDEVDRAVRELRSYEVEYRYTLPDGTLRYLCSRARPVRERAGAVKIVGCSWDVTERRRMEEHLRRTQRLESLGTLAGGVAHDLNNALAPVTMGLDLLKRRLANDNEAVESIKLMQTSVRRASSIVRQLIAFKRGAGDNKPQAPAHPKRILEVLGTTLVETFPKEISVLIEPASLELPRVVTDEREAHQVLLNLCVNARDAMPGGGRLVVGCDQLEVCASNQSQYPDLRPGPYVVFTVTDTGPGIPADIRHRVFDPFFTTKEVGKGSGLGLSTALGIVKAHRGGIQFESKEGTGTTFRVLIPVLADDEPPKPAPLVSRPAGADDPARPTMLLLVDDEVQVRELSRRALEQSGFKVMTAGNGREAVELFTQHVATVDAVIMDLLMPVMNGAAATAAIKRIRPDVPIVGASGFATDALVDEAKRAGITTFLPKPFTVTILVDAVRSAMAGRPPNGSAGA